MENINKTYQKFFLKSQDDLLKFVENTRTFAEQNVKWVHRGRSRENGVDCGGLIIKSLMEIGYNPPDFILYGRQPAKDGLFEYCKQVLDGPFPYETIDNIKYGDIILFKFSILPHHVGLVGDYLHNKNKLSLIHAYGEVEKVVEHKFDDYWLNKIHSIFRFPILNENLEKIV